LERHIGRGTNVQVSDISQNYRKQSSIRHYAEWGTNTKLHQKYFDDRRAREGHPRGSGNWCQEKKKLSKKEKRGREYSGQIGVDGITAYHGNENSERKKYEWPDG